MNTGFLIIIVFVIVCYCFEHLGQFVLNIIVNAAKFNSFLGTCFFLLLHLGGVVSQKNDRVNAFITYFN